MGSKDRQSLMSGTFTLGLSYVILLGSNGETTNGKFKLESVSYFITMHPQKLKEQHTSQDVYNLNASDLVTQQCLFENGFQIPDSRFRIPAFTWPAESDDGCLDG